VLRAHFLSKVVGCGTTTPKRTRPYQAESSETAFAGTSLTTVTRRSTPMRSFGIKKITRSYMVAGSAEVDTDSSQ
jgi:hypothetical protein